MAAEGQPYQGFLFIGLMNVDGEPVVIEYNCRLGDPETTALMVRLDADLVALCLAVANGALADFEVAISDQYAATIVLASAGYPESYQKGFAISGLPAMADKQQGKVHVFHAGTARRGAQTVTSGGRVMAVTGLGTTAPEALTNARKVAETVQFEGKYFRGDIGADLLETVPAASAKLNVAGAEAKV
jgi:phosphoribosylamine---glycine ligase